MVLIAIALFLIMLVLLPLLFADLMAAALVKLHLAPSTAIILVVTIILGGLTSNRDLRNCASVAPGRRAALWALAVAVGINVAVCFVVAKPVPEIGITMPAFVPAIVAAVSASLLLPEMAPPIAFVAGAMGPIVGADLLHIRKFTSMRTALQASGAPVHSMASSFLALSLPISPKSGNDWSFVPAKSSLRRRQ